jgi:hypothetical protein
VFGSLSRIVRVLDPGRPFAREERPEALPSDAFREFVAAWRPNPAPPEEEIELLRSAPFGTTSTSARERRRDGKDHPIERVSAAVLPGRFPADA